MSESSRQTREIRGVQISHKQHRLRKLGNKILPGLIDPPPTRHGATDLRKGDTIVFPSGRRRKVAAFIPSIEASRYAFTNRPLPDQHAANTQKQVIEDSSPRLVDEA